MLVLSYSVVAHPAKLPYVDHWCASLAAQLPLQYLCAELGTVVAHSVHIARCALIPAHIKYRRHV